MEHLLIVEGTDEQILFAHLLEVSGLTPTISLINLKGRDRLDLQIKQVRSQDQAAIGTISIVLDAEERTVDSQKKIAQILSKHKYEVPASLGEWTGVRPFIQLVLLPPGKESGCLEDLFLESCLEVGDLRADCFDALRACWKDSEITGAKWSKLFASYILTTTKDNDQRGVGMALTKPTFSKLLKQEPLLQLTRILDRIQAKAHA